MRVTINFKSAFYFLEKMNISYVVCKVIISGSSRLMNNKYSDEITKCHEIWARTFSPVYWKMAL